MRNNVTINLIRKIRTRLPVLEFMAIEEHLLEIPENELEAFWVIISAGFPVRFALLNYLNLYEYMQDKKISYKVALRTMYTIYPGLNAGIFVKHKEWFELN